MQHPPSSSTFDCMQWLATQGSQQRYTPMVRPRPVGCWTKESSTQGGGCVHGSMHGLHAYAPPPDLPVSLGTGFTDPAAYLKKDDGEACPVEVIVRGLQQAGVDPSRANVCSFR